MRKLTEHENGLFPALRVFEVIFFPPSTVIKLLDTKEDSTHYYMVLELAPNGELFDYIGSGVPEEVALFYFRQLVAAMEVGLIFPFYVSFIGWRPALPSTCTLRILLTAT